MPQELTFAIPFQSPISPHTERARELHLRWVRDRGLVRSESGMREYLSWDLPQAAARTYPYASPEDLVMLMNWFSLAFLFDDQFDANSSDRADRVAEVARELITIPFRPGGTPPDVECPITLAWSEVWSQLSDGMTESWCNRFAGSWGRFLAAHTSEVRISASGTVLDFDEYLALRRRTVGIHHSIDAAERSRRFEVPVVVQAHELMRDMRVAAADTIACMNDIHSLEREERRGDPHNLVTVIRKHLGTSRGEAIDAAVKLTNQYLERYLELESRVPQMCENLGLDASERCAVERGVEGIRHWIRGNYDWALETGRYAAEKSGPAAEAESRGQGGVDDLLLPRSGVGPARRQHQTV
ncbi:terpene synthase family protein [Streptomyces sp. 8N706]|uniref:terpene synthase family protein n=1 Tax=Streptomyces sp. 8N706 TaxID=3457416 RepID=UPI003FD5DB40